MNLDNEIALVTGASRGIGKAIATELGKAGATVVATATTQSGADNIAAYLDAENIKGSGLVLNVTDQTSIDNAMADIIQKYGNVSILVNNAGITRDNILLRMKDDEWSDIIKTNLDSVYKLCKACLKGMIKAKKGRIINISSVVGSTGNMGQSNYAAAKAGIIGFAKSLAQEVGSRNITVNTISPGFIDTDMTRALNEAQRSALIKQIPLSRLGQADDIAKAVVFLASEHAAYITGENLHINGGMYMS